jgi:hypothetical protein
LRPFCIVTGAWVRWRIVLHGAEAALRGHAHLAGAARLRRNDDHHGEAAGTEVLDRVVDAGRDQRRVLLLHLLDLLAGAQPRLAFDDEVEGIGGVEAAAFFSLLRLEANQVADQARPVEKGDAYWTLSKKPPGAANVDKIHGVVT